MNSKPLVSVIMPAYNAERFIGRAIESLLEQDYENWELVVANDCSTDKTVDIIRSYTDKQIRIVQTETNSGGCFSPRKLATKFALGEWMLLLDSDDYLASDYISTVLGHAINTGADICCGKMVLVEEQTCKPTGVTVPAAGFDYNQIISGVEALRATLPEWKIGLNGMLCRTEIWKHGYEEYEKLGKETYGIHDDEVCHKLILLAANKVVFSESIHYYRVNLSSVTHVFNKKIFDYKNALADELKIYKDRFGINSDIYKDALLHDYGAFASSICTFVNTCYCFDIQDFSFFNHEFKSWYSRIDRDIIKEKKYTNRVCLIDHYLLFMLSFLSIKNAVPVILKFAKLLWVRCMGRLSNNQYYLWYVTRRNRECEIRQKLDSVYTDDECQPFTQKNVSVCLYEGNIKAGGLADRLRGIISTYYICKEQGLDFKLCFVDPFPLQDFFVPNKYDWTIHPDMISHNNSDVLKVILDSTQDSKFQFRKQEKYLRKHLCANGYQAHVYTNAGFSYEKEYDKLFNELFKLSDRLQNSLNSQLKILGKEYISVSCRFLDLLGDFNETFGYGKALSKNEQHDLLEELIKQIEILHKKNPERKILINSDSITFLERAEQLDYTYRVPGNITHIDGENKEYSYEKYEKTFLDFLMIANAEKIYLLKSEKMIKSGYPFAASHIYNRPFETIEV